MRPPVGADPLGDRVARYFRLAPGAGRPPAGEAGWVAGAAGSEAAEARVVVYLRLGADGRLAGLRYEVWGCPHVIATLAWLAEVWPGQPLEGLPLGGPRGWQGELGVPVEKLGRLLVVEDALQAAMVQLRKSAPHHAPASGMPPAAP